MTALAPKPQLSESHARDLERIKLTIDAARTDPLALADVFILSEGDPSSRHITHRLIQEHIDACRKAGVHCIILCPPEHGKSVQVISSMLHATAKNRGRNCGIVSAAETLSKKHISRIRKFVLSGYFNDVFPEFKPDLRRGKDDKGEWSSRILYLEGQSEPAFERFPLEGSGEGHRLDEVWLDDCVARACQFSEAERRNTASAIKDTWLNRLKRGAIAIITNNVWHKDDVIHELMGSASCSTLRIQYEGVERLHFQVLNPPPTWKYKTEGDLPHWNMWPISELEKKRGEGIRNWKGRFEQKTVSPEECRFPERGAWERYQDIRRDRDGNPEGMIVAFLDISGGKRAAKLDWAALVLLMAYRDGTADVLDCWVDRQSPQVQVGAAFDMHEKYSANGFGGIHLLKIEMLAKDEDWGKDAIALVQNERRKAGRPWQLPWGIKNPVENKEVRIERLGPPLCNKWLRFPADMEARISAGGENGRSWERLASMLEDWPMGDHDDAPDALSGAWDLAKGAFGMTKPTVPTVRRTTELGNYMRNGF